MKKVMFVETSDSGIRDLYRETFPKLGIPYQEFPSHIEAKNSFNKEEFY